MDRAPARPQQVERGSTQDMSKAKSHGSQRRGFTYCNGIGSVMMDFLGCGFFLVSGAHASFHWAQGGVITGRYWDGYRGRGVRLLSSILGQSRSGDRCTARHRRHKIYQSTSHCMSSLHSPRTHTLNLASHRTAPAASVAAVARCPGPRLRRTSALRRRNGRQETGHTHPQQPLQR